MTWQENRQDLNLIENLWQKLFKIVHGKTPFTQADLLTDI